MATIGGAFAVNASAYQEVELDTEGMTLDMIAEAVEENASGISLCHQCGGEMSNPELGDLVALVIDGTEHTRGDDGVWRKEGDPHPDRVILWNSENPLDRMRDAILVLSSLDVPELHPKARVTLETFARQVGVELHPASTK